MVIMVIIRLSIYHMHVISPGEYYRKTFQGHIHHHVFWEFSWPPRPGLVRGHLQLDHGNLQTGHPLCEVCQLSLCQLLPARNRIARGWVLQQKVFLGLLGLGTSEKDGLSFVEKNDQLSQLLPEIWINVDPYPSVSPIYNSLFHQNWVYEPPKLGHSHGPPWSFFFRRSKEMFTLCVAAISIIKSKKRFQTESKMMSWTEIGRSELDLMVMVMIIMKLYMVS